MLKEFKDFMTRGNIMAIAIGLTMAAAFGKVTDALGTNVITPIVGRIWGDKGIDGLSIHLGKGNYINLGAVLNALVVFIITAAVLFFLIIRPLLRMGHGVSDKE